MGESRFGELVSLLPRDVPVLGLDEHTACILDMDTGCGSVRGVGRVVFRSKDREATFQRGDSFPLDILRGETGADVPHPALWKPGTEKGPGTAGEDDFWSIIHRIEESFREGMERLDPEKSINALLQLDQTVWKARQDLESEESVSQAREILRECLVLVGTILTPDPGQQRGLLSPLVDDLLSLRDTFRDCRQWREADAIRDILTRAGIIVEDTAKGYRWKTKS